MLSVPVPLTVLLGELPTLVRLELTRLLLTQPNCRVVGTAGSADELVTLARRFRPTLVILGEHNLLSLDRLHRQHPCSVLLYATAVPLTGVLREAARWGLYNYVGPLQSGAEEAFRSGVLSQLRSVPEASGMASFVSGIRHIVSAKPDGLVIIGASTGGTLAVEQIVQKLDPTLSSAVLVAVHLPVHFTASFVKRLQRLSPLPVKIGQAGLSLEAGHIIVAPGGQNMVVKSVKRGPWEVWQTDFSIEPNLSADQPSIDMLMQSAAQVAGSEVVGVVLTGLGNDGTYGARHIQDQGGQVIAQNEESAAVFSMPHSVIRAGYADAVLPLEHIAAAINRRTTLVSASYSPVETLN